MRKIKFLLITLFLLEALATIAQNYHPTLVANRCMYYRYASFNVAYDYYYKVLEDDTLINCLRYKRILRQSDDSVFKSKKYYLMREDTIQKRIYRYDNGQETLLYDFSVPLFSNFYVGGYPYILVQIDTVNTSLGTRKMYRYKENLSSPKTFNIIESIGSTIDFSMVFNIVSDPSYILKCFYAQNRLSYSYGSTSNCLDSILPKPNIIVKKVCHSDTIIFSSDISYATSWDWEFRKQSDNSFVTSTVQNPVMLFADTGNYKIQLIIGSDTAIKHIYVSPPIELDFNLGNDTTLCVGDSIVLEHKGTKYNCYQWQNFSTSATYTAKQTGLYVVTATNDDFCQLRDSIFVIFTSPTKPLITRIGDTLFASQGDYIKYQWYKDGQQITFDTLHYTIRASDGNYKVYVTSPLGCSTFSETYNTTNIIEHIKNDIKVYPNPTSGTLHIELPGVSQESIHTIRLINTIGQPVYIKHYSSRGSNTATLQFKGLSNGLYTLELTTNTQTYLTRITIIQ